MWKTETIRDLTFLAKQTLACYTVLSEGEFNINGIRNKDIRQYITANSNKVSRLLKRLLVHRFIKKAQSTYKYYITK